MCNGPSAKSELGRDACKDRLRSITCNLEVLTVKFYEVTQNYFIKLNEEIVFDF